MYIIYLPSFLRYLTKFNSQTVGEINIAMTTTDKDVNMIQILPKNKNNTPKTTNTITRTTTASFSSDLNLERRDSSFGSKTSTLLRPSIRAEIEGVETSPVHRN